MCERVRLPPGSGRIARTMTDPPTVLLVLSGRPTDTPATGGLHSAPPHDRTAHNESSATGWCGTDRLPSPLLFTFIGGTLSPKLCHRIRENTTEFALVLAIN
ncbi:unnamed protein product [Soboliphyme baturini]|uniref:Secreted protein n=1 Tax=Soboliphyme baturini TaxID=241478 RepID=A0A183ID48_9BILA|nr:unnamed protein product [Soboliphyme baturini]